MSQVATLQPRLPSHPAAVAPPALQPSQRVGASKPADASRGRVARWYDHLESVATYR